MTYLPNRKSIISTGNNTTGVLTTGATFTGDAELNNFPDVMVQVTTDQDGTLYCEFSPDGTNWDTSLSFDYDASRINPPHIFTKASRYYRTRFTNEGDATSSFMRLNTYFGEYGDLTSPINGTLAETYDAKVVRPTDYRFEVALGKRQGSSTVNKFGFNEDVDSAAEEIVASFGGSFNPATDVMASGQTFDITYNSGTDGSSSNGATSLLITYLDENFLTQNGVHVLGSGGSDTASFSGVGINRVVLIGSGSTNSNGSDITITASVDGSTQAQIPAGKSVTQQLLFHTQINHTLLVDYIDLSVLKLSGGGAPRVTIRMYSWSRVTETLYEVFRKVIDTNVENNLSINFGEPFVFTGREVVFITAETTVNNTVVNARFSGIETRTSI